MEDGVKVAAENVESNVKPIVDVDDNSNPLIDGANAAKVQLEQNPVVVNVNANTVPMLNDIQNSLNNSTFIANVQANV